MKLTQEVDGLAFIKEQFEAIIMAHTHCYPNNILIEGRCHGALESIKSSANAALNFLNNIKTKEVE